MEKYSAIKFESEFLNKSQVGSNRFRVKRYPGNWEVVMELIPRRLTDEFSIPSYDYRMFVFKTDKYRLLGGSGIDRILVHTSEVKSGVSTYANESAQLHLNIAMHLWERDYAAQAAEEKRLLEEARDSDVRDALEQIENVVKSISRKDPNKLIKSDFSFITTDVRGRWRAFYPSIDKLVDYHLSKPMDEQDLSYVNFLKSDTLEELRKVWDAQEGITAGE